MEISKTAGNSTIQGPTRPRILDAPLQISMEGVMLQSFAASTSLKKEVENVPDDESQQSPTSLPKEELLREEAIGPIPVDEATNDLEDSQQEAARTSPSPRNAIMADKWRIYQDSIRVGHIKAGNEGNYLLFLYAVINSEMLEHLRENHLALSGTLREDANATSVNDKGNDYEDDGCALSLVWSDGGEPIVVNLIAIPLDQPLLDFLTSVNQRIAKRSTVLIVAGNDAEQTKKSQEIRRGEDIGEEEANPRMLEDVDPPPKRLRLDAATPVTAEAADQPGPSRLPIVVGNGTQDILDADDGTVVAKVRSEEIDGQKQLHVSFLKPPSAAVLDELFAIILCKYFT